MTFYVDDITETMMSVSEEHRALWPNYCKRLCEPFAVRKCVEVGCQGYRRRNLLGDQVDRGLLSGAAFTCTQQVNYINTTLTKLVTQNQVSSSCKTLLSKPRSITCFDDVIYGVVEYFKLWDTNASPQKVINSNYMGQEICKGLEVNFEAVTNDCVDFLLTTITGPNGYYADSGEYSRPFSVFGDSFSTTGTLFGKKLPYLGQYELTALPDGLVDKKKVLKFNVVPGKVEAVKLWDTTTKTVMNANFAGGNICNNKSINFEAVMPCTDTSKITLTSTTGYSSSNKELSPPFSILNNDSNGDFFGKKLSNGLYTLIIYPDEAVSNQVKTIQFNVVSC